MKLVLFNQKLEDHLKLLRETKKIQYGRDCTKRIPENKESKSILLNKRRSSERKTKLAHITTKTWS